MSVGRKRKVLLWGALLLPAIALAGCATSIADIPLAGAPADASRASQPGGYLPVEELPPDRSDPAIAQADLDKLKADLIAARNRQSVLATDAAAKTSATTTTTTK